MMYRGKTYRTYRHFLNYQLHALSAVISGDDTVIDGELAFRKLSSVKELSDKDARELVKQLRIVASKISDRVSSKDASGKDKATKKQIAMIYRIMKYKYNWSDGAMLSYLLKTLPEYRAKLSQWELKNNKVSRLINYVLTAKDADKLIKRLLKMEEKNEEKNKPQP